MSTGTHSTVQDVVIDPFEILTVLRGALDEMLAQGRVRPDAQQVPRITSATVRRDATGPALELGATDVDGVLHQLQVWDLADGYEIRMGTDDHVTEYWSVDRSTGQLTRYVHGRRGVGHEAARPQRAQLARGLGRWLDTLCWGPGMAMEVGVSHTTMFMGADLRAKEPTHRWAQRVARSIDEQAAPELNATDAELEQLRHLVLAAANSTPLPEDHMVADEPAILRTLLIGLEPLDPRWRTVTTRMASPWRSTVRPGEHVRVRTDGALRQGVVVRPRTTGTIGCEPRHDMVVVEVADGRHHTVAHTDVVRQHEIEGPAAAAELARGDELDAADRARARHTTDNTEETP